MPLHCPFVAAEKALFKAGRRVACNVAHISTEIIVMYPSLVGFSTLGLATRYDKFAIVYRATLILNAVFAWAQQLANAPWRWRASEANHSEIPSSPVSGR